MSNTSEILIANAPVSYGAFEVTVGHDPNVPDGLAILDEVAAAGYDGIDLGPVGYLGEGAQLGERLAERNLGLAGAYLEFPFANAAALDNVMHELDATLDTFDAIASYVTTIKPKPTIADNGSDDRRANPGSGMRRPESSMSASEWDLWVNGLNRVVKHCRDRGYEPTFHNETGTYMEAPHELEKMLESSDVNLCLDTGHFLLGGGNPVSFFAKWQSRINQVHTKDSTMSVFERIVKEGGPTTDIWEQEAFPVLGQGDGSMDEFVIQLRDSGYSGWVVVEQDCFPKSKERFAKAIADQRTNRAYLAGLGL